MQCSGPDPGSLSIDRSYGSSTSALPIRGDEYLARVRRNEPRLRRVLVDRRREPAVSADAAQHRRCKSLGPVPTIDWARRPKGVSSGEPYRCASEGTQSSNAAMSASRLAKNGRPSPESRNHSPRRAQRTRKIRMSLCPSRQSAVPERDAHSVPIPVASRRAGVIWVRRSRGDGRRSARSTT
jgi:hypothetical protein